ncbi:MAG: endonuclease MutS2 [Clostridia bacterium]|nr:endonuclease MutS2 [Clostridia bacterium]
MNKHYRALELDKVLDLLAAHATCDDAAEAARALQPSPQPGEVQRLLNDTDAAFCLMAKFGAPPFGDVKNVSNALRRAQAGAMLSLQELLRIAGTLRGIRSVSDWHAHCEGMGTCLDDRFSVLSPNKYLEDRIRTAIVSEDEVSDNASVELSLIRRKMRAASARVREQLDKLIHSQTAQKALQEPIVTIRGGRFVVPVKAEHRSSIAGLVHDTSSTGATVFIEPMGAVEANNELKVLESQEAAEIERIIRDLSAEAGSFADSIIGDYEVLVGIDLIFAKARLGYQMKATVPAVSDDGHVVLHKARHPLIDPKKVVPIDVELGGTFDTLVITGPNTGGKTVTLKTLGLLTLMTMCGLMAPVRDGSRVSVFRTVLADIGDEQSIEQSLSTFSAHMTNLIRIVGEADEHSLVLLDELGAGTDPVEGAALATAIVERLRAQGARVAATTHYAEMKAYAIQTAGVENGSCEFDVQSLRPTYRLLVGVPGRSNAFAISERLGMDSAIVDRARTLVSGDDRRLEEVVVVLEEKRLHLEQELQDAKRAAESAKRANEKAEEQLAALQAKKEQELEDARDEARRVVERARRDAEDLIAELDALRKQKNAADFSKKAAAARSQLRGRLNKLEADIDPVTHRPRGEYRLPRPLVIGDDVLIVDIDKNAVVTALPDGKTVEVQAGIIRTRVSLDNLRLIEKKPTTSAKKGKGGVYADVSRGTRDVRTELDLRGMTSDEALLELDKFLDDARLGGLDRLTVIHGKGTGALRAAVHAHLKSCVGVKGFRLGLYGEGETGVTIVEMK